VFIRFIVTKVDRDSGRRQGLFQAAEALEQSAALSGVDREQLETIGNWFDKHLKRPARLAVSSRPHSKAQAISWYRDTATAHIAKMRELQEVLKRNGLTVEMIKAKRLGYVLYEDEFQIAAYPFNDTPT
jgi:hypothetical protein